MNFESEEEANCQEAADNIYGADCALCWWLLEQANLSLAPITRYV